MLQRGLVVPYDFGNHEIQELFGELGIEPGVFGERSEPRNLFGFPYRIGRRQAMRRFQLADLLSDLETLGEEMHKGRIHVVDAHPKPQQLLGDRVNHGAQPSQTDLPRDACRVRLDTMMRFSGTVPPRVTCSQVVNTS
jgi:hypothetical protein